MKRVWALVNLGNGGREQNSLDVVAHHLILDRMYIHGDPKHDCFRCVALNSASSAVIDSYLSEGHVVGFDAQAICGVNGPGPFKIVNNYLEGSGENVMFGGADPAIPDLVPSDIEFRRNHCFKPLSWKIGHPSYAGIPWAVKNLFELKNARRVLIEGNVFENNWVHAQNGTGILFTVRNQSGTAPWSAVQDVTMINNRLRNSPTAFVVMGYDSPNQSQQTQRFLIRNNLFEQVERSGFMITWGSDDVEIDHNTFVPTNYSVVHHVGPEGARRRRARWSGTPCHRFKLTNNIFGLRPVRAGRRRRTEHVRRGVSRRRLREEPAGGPRRRPGRARREEQELSRRLPVRAEARRQRARRTTPIGRPWDSPNFAGGDYRLTEASKYRALGTNGKALGADIDAIVAALKKSR